MILVVTFLLGFVFGAKFEDISKYVIGPGNNILDSSCNYNGQKYKSGDSFMAEDGCNSCGCEGGQVACTLMACEQK